MNAEIIADSINIETGDRLTTFVLPRFPKILAQELLTHRAFSRNSASSRAIPLSKTIQMVKDDPYIPLWTANKKGMVGSDSLDCSAKEQATSLWIDLLNEAIKTVEKFAALNIAKQDANRALEIFMHIPIIVTATEWDNFFSLRTADDVQPRFRDIAREMKRLREENQPIELQPGEWHIPYLGGDGDEAESRPLLERLKISAARCARISYASHDGDARAEKDFELHDRLVDSGHFSPLEHAAKVVPAEFGISTRNFRGFYQYRSHLEDGFPVSTESNNFQPSNQDAMWAIGAGRHQTDAMRARILELEKQVKELEGDRCST